MSGKCKSKVCSRDKICNPKSGRCVSRTGNIGKQIINSIVRRSKYDKEDKCSDIHCEDNKICNPKTGRCILKQNSEPYENKYTKYIYKKYSKIVDEFLPESYILVDLIKTGAYGEIFIAYIQNDETYRALKFQTFEKNKINNFENDIYMYSIFQEKGLALPLYNSIIYKHNNTTYCYMEMGKLDGTLKTILSGLVSDEILENIIDYILELLHELCKYGLIHGDFHWDNIGFTLKKHEGKSYIRLWLIDFAFSCCYEKHGNEIKQREIECNFSLEILQAIRTLFILQINKYNKQYLAKELYKIYCNVEEKRYDESISVSQIFEIIESVYQKKLNEYMYKYII